MTLLVVGLYLAGVLSIGLLMFAFVAYQLWGTGIETARSQRSLEDRFEELVEATKRASVDAPATARALLRSHPDDPATEWFVPDDRRRVFGPAFLEILSEA